MGSGCTGSNNDFFQKIEDFKIKYTGPAINALGICNGDTLNEIEAVVLQKLLDYSTGIGISIPSIDLTTCDLFKQDLTCCQTCTDLPCLMKAYLTGLCTLFTDFTTLQNLITTLLNGPYNIGCLSNLGTNPTLNTIIQELIFEFCALVTTVNNLQIQVNNLSSGLNTTIGNFLLTAIQSCNTQVSKSGSGASATITFKGFTPLNGIIAYGGPTTGLFDSTGLGLVNTEMCGWALCNGNNGTIDMRENVPMGAGAGVMGGSGSGPSNIGTPSNYGMGALVGEPKHILLTAELPTTSVSVSGTHSHDLLAVSDAKSTTNISNNIWVIDCTTTAPGTVGPDSSTPPYNIPMTFGGKVLPTTISLTGGITGASNTPHENRQPSRALIFIQRIA